MNFTQRRLSLSLAILLLVGASCQNRVPSSSNEANETSAGTHRQAPNIIFILADDLGWAELGCYGNTFNETPNLDKLALQGMRFTHAYAAAPVCSPTRASFMTGQYPARVGITDFLAPKSGKLLDPAKYITINEALASEGYHTGLIGKWHLDTEFNENKGGPDKHGFHEVIGTETSYIADGDYFYPYEKISTFVDGAENEYLTDRQSAEAADFIKRNKEKPFFLYLSYYSVHTKLAAPEALVEKYKKKFDARYGEGKAKKLFDVKNQRHQSNHRDNPYLAAMLEAIDSGVGRIVRALETNGLADNTLVVFYSDNGGAGKVANNGNLRMNKTWLYEGGIREPLIIRLPGRIQPGVVTDVPVSTIDFYPTFLDVAHAEKSAGHLIDGVSLVPLLTTEEAPVREALYWHYPSETGNWKERMASAVRKGDYKLIQFYADNRVELYDLRHDPEEKTNLVEKLPGKVAELQALLDQWKATVKAAPPVL